MELEKQEDKLKKEYEQWQKMSSKEKWCSRLGIDPKEFNIDSLPLPVKPDGFVFNGETLEQEKQLAREYCERLMRESMEKSNSIEQEILSGKQQ